MKLNIKSILPFSSQLIILILCFILQLRIGTLSPNLLYIIKYSPYIILGIGVILSIRFNKSRVFFVILYLLTCQMFLTNYSSFLIDKSIFFTLLYPIIGILLPINLIIFSQLKESGIFSIWGKTKFVFMALQLYCVFMIIMSKSQFTKDMLNTSLNFFKITKYPMPGISLFVFYSGILFLIIKILIKRNYFDISILLVLTSILAALLSVKSQISVSLFFSAAGLILTLGIIEVSHSMAYLDELTGIPSRRALREDLLKLGTKYTIAMVDIDFFKKFNDTYGHEVGDEVLKIVASNLDRVNGGGKAYRYGGEEFTIIFPGKSTAEVIPCLEQLREAVSKSGYRQSSKGNTSTTRSSTSKQIFVNISIGVAEKNTTYKIPTDVIGAADKALYRAKKKGRNCVSK